MTRLRFHIDKATIPPERRDDDIHVWLYGSIPPFPGVGSVGSQAMDTAARFTVRPSGPAIDFLSIAMAVTAADTFVLRPEAPDGWARAFEITLPLAEPEKWIPLKQKLEATLRFLSGDTWFFTFAPGGAPPPSAGDIRRKIDVFDLSKTDCASLFSGGLDSAIGALDLLRAGQRPLLVSHSAHKDAGRQSVVAKLLPTTCQRVSVNTYPTGAGADDDSMRTRSFQFIALGVLAAQCIATFRNKAEVELFMCENGLIALNPPLTSRRLGSHSTRTAHPNFLNGVRELLNELQVPVRIVNPYSHHTKGEMAKAHAQDPRFAALAAETVSCGKWKRRKQQCGRCVPCLIRRAAFHAAGVIDHTSYQFPDLHVVMNDEEGRDDLIAVLSAIERTHNVGRWVLQAGPLPATGNERASYFEVAERGLAELAVFLAAQGFAHD